LNYVTKIYSGNSSNFSNLINDNEKFERLKPQLIEFAQKAIEFDRCAQMGHIFKSVIGCEVGE
jgi:hypothetical protein